MTILIHIRLLSFTEKNVVVAYLSLLHAISYFPKILAAKSLAISLILSDSLQIPLSAEVASAGVQRPKVCF